MGHSRPRRTISVSELTATQYADQLSGEQTAVIVRAGGATLGASSTAVARATLPTRRGTVVVGSARYRATTENFAGFAGRRVDVSVLSDLTATDSSVGEDRLLAAAFMLGFLVLAFFFTMLASRGFARSGLALPDRGPPAWRRRFLRCGRDGRPRRVRGPG